MKQVYLETFGCQMNVLDSELVEGQLRALGYKFVSKPDEADIVLYNTCSVRQKSEDKVLSRLGLMGIRKASEPNLVVGVIGCMAERDGTSLLKRMPQVDLLCGPGELDRLPTLLENVYKTGRQQSALAGNQSRRSSVTADLDEDHLEALDLSRSFSPEKHKYQAYIRIVRGCTMYCWFGIGNRPENCHRMGRLDFHLDQLAFHGGWAVKHDDLVAAGAAQKLNFRHRFPPSLCGSIFTIQRRRERRTKFNSRSDPAFRYLAGDNRIRRFVPSAWPLAEYLDGLTDEPPI